MTPGDHLWGSKGNFWSKFGSIVGIKPLSSWVYALATLVPNRSIAPPTTTTMRAREAEESPSWPSLRRTPEPEQAVSASRLLGLIMAVLLGALALALGVLTLAAGTVLAVSQTEFGQQWLTTRLAEAISDGDRRVEIANLAGLPFDARVGKLTVADRGGVWLDANDLQLAWRPSGLLRGRLEVEAATAKTIRLLRPPAGTEGQAERPGLPKLPKPPSYLPPVTIGRLMIERLEVEPAVFGERIDLVLEGYLKNDVSAGDWAGELKLNRIGEHTLTFQGSARLDRGADQLTLRLYGRDDGLISKLFGRARAAPLRVTLEGAGPIRDWQGNLHLALRGLGTFEGDLMSAVGDRTTAGLRGQLSLDQPPDLATKRVKRALFALLDEPLELEATLRSGDAGSFSVDPFRLTGAEFELSGQSRFDGTGRLVSAKGDAILPSIRPIAAAFNREGEGRGWFGVEVRAVEDDQVVKVGFDGGIENLDQIPEAIAPLLGRTLSLTGDLRYLPGGGFEIGDFALKSGGLQATGELAFGLAEKDELAGELRLLLPDLGRLETALGQPIAGAAELRATLGGTTTAPTLALRGDMTAERQGVELQGELTVDGRADFARRSMAEGQATLQALGLILEASFRAGDLGSESKLTGQLAVAEFDPLAVWTRLGGSYRPADDTALRSAALQLGFESVGAQLIVEPIRGHVDQTELDGQIEVRSFRPPDLTFALHAGRLDLDRYQAKADDQKTEATDARGLDAEALAKKWQDLGLKGVIRIDELILNGEPSKDVEIDLTWDP